MNKQIIFTAVVVAIVAGGIYVFFMPRINNQREITIQSSAVLAKVTKAELLKESDAVVIGFVRSLQSFKGKSEIRPGKEDIFTNVSLEIKEYLYNPKNLSDSKIMVRVLGGTVGDTTMNVSESPIFTKGERVIVFLKQNPDRTFSVVGWVQGKYTIDNGTVGMGHEKVFIRDIFGHNLTVSEFKQEIATK